jgi:hypothetical protein
MPDKKDATEPRITLHMVSSLDGYIARLLGDGLRLFGGFRAEEKVGLKNVIADKNGFVELSYAAR